MHYEKENNRNPAHHRTVCRVRSAPAPAQENTPDIDAIVQQSVEKVIAQYKEAEKEKDAEIAELKAQLEEFTSQGEETPEATNLTETDPAEESPAPASSQPEEPESIPRINLIVLENESSPLRIIFIKKQSQSLFESL